jgi:glycosyltransferase involved in cell wall biosynthesis
MISVIIPTYNFSHYIAEAIHSVLNQSLTPMEVIVVDNGSTDQTYETIQPFLSQITYIQLLENHGASFARNKGVEHAKGEYLAFLDADDYWAPQKLERQHEMIQQNNTDLVFCYVQAFHSQEMSEILKTKLHCSNELLAGYTPSALFIRKSTFLDIGYFDISLKVGEFIEWYLRAKNLNLNSKIDEACMVYRRIHAGHVMKSYKDYFPVIRKKLHQTSDDCS